MIIGISTMVLWVCVMMGSWYALRMGLQQSQALDIIVNPESSESSVREAWFTLYGH